MNKTSIMFFMAVMFILCSVAGAQAGDIYLINVLRDWKTILSEVGVIIAAILVTLGAIVYGISQMQPAEVRGKWESTAISMVLGGIIIAVIIGAVGIIIEFAQNMLKPVSEVQPSSAGTGQNTPDTLNYVPSAAVIG